MMTTHDLTTEEGMLAWLHASEYDLGEKIASVTRLPEGFGGFVYRAHLQDSRRSVIVKHAEGYASRAQSWKLDQSRMDYEYEAMHYLSNSDMQSDKSIRTPRLLFYDRNDYVLIMEDAGNLPSVKGWLQPGADLETASEVGRKLGRFLASVHDRTAGDDKVKARFNGNATAKYLSGTLYFGGLPTAAARFGYEDEFLKQVTRIGQQEVNEANDVLTLGDFWTGNVLIDTNDHAEVYLYIIDLELSKPGTAAFDIGQMAAELFCIEVFRDPQLGKVILDAFLTSYAETKQGRVDAAKVAIRIGVHLLVMMPNAWSNEATPERIREVVRIGIELIRMGHEGDEAGLRGSIVRPLLLGQDTCTE